MSSAFDLTEIRRCRALVGGCPGPQGPSGPAGPSGPGVLPLYGSFLSSTTQNATTTNPVAITYSEKNIRFY